MLERDDSGTEDPERGVKRRGSGVWGGGAVAPPQYRIFSSLLLQSTADYKCNEYTTKTALDANSAQNI